MEESLTKSCPKCGKKNALDSIECQRCGIVFEKYEQIQKRNILGATKQAGFPNYKKYASLTRSKKWERIFEINGLTFASFGTIKELQILPDYLEHDEVVFALASGIMSQTKTSNAFDWGNRP